MQVGELHLGQAEIIEAVRQASKESGWRETNGRTDGRTNGEEQVGWGEKMEGRKTGHAITGKRYGRV
jgi:hypothetical protein